LIKKYYTYNTDNILPNMFKRKKPLSKPFAGELFPHF